MMKVGHLLPAAGRQEPEGWGAQGPQEPGRRGSVGGVSRGQRAGGGAPASGPRTGDGESAELLLLLNSERGRERERETSMMRENHGSAASCTPPTRDPGHNLGMCPDRESNLGPFSLQADALSTEPHQPGQCRIILCPQVTGTREAL
uniref:Uncharacterized protein n=1 Tax=Myotis myotis TaxID=51298 RepID=A0A7J7R4T1_MYOMY|nr:hypothetical protein mMyoMyo1_010896 [Myotis myotis]